MKSSSGTPKKVAVAPPDAFLQSIPQITVEFHDFNGMIQREEAERAVARLRDLGFDAVRMWMRSYGDTLFVNRKLVRVGPLDQAWSRLVQRNWWWFVRFAKRKLEVDAACLQRSWSRARYGARAPRRRVQPVVAVGLVRHEVEHPAVDLAAIDVAAAAAALDVFAAGAAGAPGKRDERG